MKHFNATGRVPPLGKYSHVTLAGGMAFISGQLPIDINGEPVTTESFAVQAAQALANLDACLTSAGLSRDDLVQVRVYVTKMADWATFDDIYGEWIGSHRPARAVAGVNELHYGASVEIEAVAQSRA